MKKTYKESAFLTDRNHIIVLETIIGAANAAIPGSLESSEVLVPNASDGVTGKHLPIIETSGSHITVKVGNNSHPMSEEHSISFACLLTQAEEVVRVCPSPNCEPVARFTVEKGDALAAAYAYCSLHGFWRIEV